MKREKKQLTNCVNSVPKTENSRVPTTQTNTSKTKPNMSKFQLCSRNNVILISNPKDKPNNSFFFSLSTKQTKKKLAYFKETNQTHQRFNKKITFPHSIIFKDQIFNTKWIEISANSCKMWDRGIFGFHHK